MLGTLTVGSGPGTRIVAELPVPGVTGVVAS